jgi:hypothetical protein
MALCIPPFGWVPGVNGPPDWISAAPGGNPTLRDPRWVGAIRLSADAGGGEKFTIRAVADTATSRLFLSVLVQLDPSPAFQVADRLWIGFNPTLAGGTPRILRLNYNNTSAEANSSALSPQLYAWDVATSRWADAGAASPAWVTNTRVWKEDDGGRSWAFQMVINMVAAGLISAAAPTAPFGLFFQARVEAPAIVPNYKFPTGMPVINPSAGLPNGLDGIINPATASHWASFTHGGACDTGVWIDPSRIGTVATANNTIGEIRINQLNTFYANPRNDSAASVDIRARFRLANWGSAPESNWRDLNVTSQGTVAAKSNGNLTMTWRPDPAVDVQLPNPPGGTQNEVTFYTANRHQCMMVELEAAAGTVYFSRSSCVTNMNFVTTSKFSRQAEISVRNLNDSFPLARRDVYVYVERVNMPVKIDDRTREKYRQVQQIYRGVHDIDNDNFTHEQRMVAILAGDLRHLRFVNFSDAVGWVRSAIKEGQLVVSDALFDLLRGFGIDADNLEGLIDRYEQPARTFVENLTYDENGEPQIDAPVMAIIRILLDNLEYRGDVTLPPLNYPPLEQLEQVMPTVRYHVFHDSGLRTQVNGEWRPIVTSQPSFGYYMWLDHDVQQWELRLQNAEKVGENLYLIRPPTNGAVKVTTSIHAVEPDETNQIEPPEVIKTLPTYKEDVRLETGGDVPDNSAQGCLEAIASVLEGFGPVGRTLAQIVRSFGRRSSP